MNVKKMATELGVEENEILELLEILVETCKSDLDMLQAAIDGRLVSQAIECAHSIKGAALNFGLREISELARTIEMNARRGALDGGSETVSSLRHLVADIATVLT